MAGRPPKESLDYSSWDVSILDNDEKIDMLIDSQGIGAFTVYFYLCQKAFGTKGYYLEWNYSRCATIARKLGKGACAEFVKNVVDKCFQCCLFDKELFELHGILTSKGIQRRFLIVAKDRTAPKINEDFWLLDDKESAGLVSRTQKLNYEGSKLNYEGSKLNYKPLKESKVNNSKVNKIKVKERKERNTSDQPTEQAEELIDGCLKAYEKYIGIITPNVVEGIDFSLTQGMESAFIIRLIEYVAEQGGTKRSWNYLKAVLLGNLNSGIKTIDDYNRTKADFVNSNTSKKPSKRSKFNNYDDDNKTDYAQLEEQILNSMLEDCEND